MTKPAADPGVFYVCDQCGSIVVADRVPEEAEWTCENCGGHAAWEFEPEARANAELHAADIRRTATARIFRRG